MNTVLLAIVVAIAINVSVSAYAGALIARARGLSWVSGLVPGAILPWVGLVVPCALSSTGAARQRVAPVGRPRLIGAGLAAMGIFGIALSAFTDWFTVTGVVQAQGQEIAESMTASPGDTPVGAVLLLATAVLSGGLFAAHVRRGGLRFALPGMFIVTAFGSTTSLVLIASGLASDAADVAARLSAGHAQGSLELGLGGVSAILGSAFLCVGWIVSTAAALEAIAEMPPVHVETSVQPAVAAVPFDPWATGLQAPAQDAGSSPSTWTGPKGPAGEPGGPRVPGSPAGGW